MTNKVETVVRWAQLISN